MASLAQSERPSRHLLDDTQEARARYLNLCIPLQKAAYKGDWRAIWHIIGQDSAMLSAAITESWATVLHIAAEANHIHVVKELVRLMDKSDLELQDKEGNTAFLLAAKFGNLQITEIMWQANTLLPTIRDNKGLIPISMAASKGESEMAWYLYPKTVQTFEDRDWTDLFFFCIKSGLFDLALRLLNERPKLAFARDGNNETALHLLSRKSSCMSCSNSAYGKKIMNSCMNQNQVLQLVKCLWKEIIPLKLSDMMEIVRKPSNMIFNAAEVGNLEFLVELMNTYPELIREVDSRNRSIIHIAVLHRHAGIFNLIHEIVPFKDFIVSRVDNIDKSNLLHLAAKLAPQDRIKSVSGAAFQMMFELLWFMEVKKIMLPAFIEMKNSDGLSPSQLFSVEHEELLKKAESWIMRTSNSCTGVSTLIVASVFSAAFSILGGNNDSTGTSNSYMEKPSFLIFFISNATAFILSLVSVIIFLSIIISRCAEEDFLKSLPLKLILGLIALFMSIFSMMVAFSSVFFVTYYHSLKWVPSLISILAFVPIPLFVFLHFSLWSDILYTTYSCNSLFRRSKNMLY